MGDNVIKVLKATYGSMSGDRNTGNANKASQTQSAVNPKSNGQQQGASVPHFGVKGRENLTQDMFQYKGQVLSRDEVKKKSYSDVYKHESAHLSAAGKYATSGINIDFDGNGFATSGHVNVSMPKLDPNNLDETINHAETVIASAEAPASFDELSDADRNVASKARAVKAQALAMRGNQSKDSQPGKVLNFIA